MSRTLREPLPWSNSALLAGDASESVAGLKARDEGHLTILGSDELIHTLVRHRLIDEYLPMIHPLVLGRGRRLFPADGALATLRLRDSVTTPTGVIVATYEAAS